MEPFEENAQALPKTPSASEPMSSKRQHYASPAAGEEIATAMSKACAKSGCATRKEPPPNSMIKQKRTIADKAVETIVKRKGVNGGARILAVLKAANHAPISA